MKTMLTRSWLAALVLFASLASAGEPHIGRFTRYDNGDYVIVTSRSAQQAKLFMEQLVQFRMTLELMLGTKATREVFPTRILITSDADWKRYLQPREGVAGFFHRARFSNNMVIDGDAPLSDALHIMFHEYTHYFLASQFSGEYPPWFNEGMAELMGYAKFQKGMAILQIPLDRVHDARNGKWIPFDRLIRVDEKDPEYQSHNLAPTFYAESWLTVQYGIVEQPEFGKQIFSYLTQINRLVPQEEAARKAFGADTSEVDKKLQAYLATSDRQSGALKLANVPAVELAAGAQMDEVDTLATFADVMLDSRSAPDRIRPLVEALGRRDRNQARAAILAARLAVMTDDSTTFEAAVDKAEAAMPADDWEQRRELAGVLLTSGSDTSPLSTRKTEDSKKDVARAMKWFGEAIAHNGADIEALWGYGTAAVRLNTNLGDAERYLLSAYRRAPSSPDIAQSLAELKGRQQQPEQMLVFLKDVIRNATDLNARRWAADTYHETQKWIDERDAVEAENRKRRDEYDKQMAEYEKKNGKAKKKT